MLHELRIYEVVPGRMAALHDRFAPYVPCYFNPPDTSRAKLILQPIPNGRAVNKCGLLGSHSDLRTSVHVGHRKS